MLKRTLLLLPLMVFLLSADIAAQKAKPVSCPDYKLRVMMEKYHCNPRPVNEQFTADIMNDFMDALDQHHLYFTAADIKEITSYKLLLEEELAGKNQLFINKVIGLHQLRLKRADSILHSILQKPFDFSLAENIIFSDDSSDYAKDMVELKTRWNKWLKYRVLERMEDKAFADSVPLTAAYIKTNEAAERTQVLKAEERQISRILEHAGGYGNYVATVFCSTLASAYDPHSDFYPVEEKEEFTNELSNQELSFGLYIDENDKGEVEISHLVPGSAAWKGGELNQNDVLVSVKLENGKTVDLSGADEDEIEEILEEAAQGRVELTVRKQNGIEKTVKLQKQIVRRDEDFVKSFVLAGKQKLGYILLPGFYSEWGSEEGVSCANDVAKEIMKLKKENVSGIILDLRSNGGGYMDEAMQLAGIFIEEGTLGIARRNTAKTGSLKDPNRGTMYDGPLLVMINGGSASASEFVAGALQDYNRAIIAGGASFGKATFQSILPLDTTIDINKYEDRDRDEGDFVKLTLGKLYRATGRSNQLNGVQPDIVFPEIGENFSYRESSMKYALSADTVKRAVYYTPLPPLRIKDVVAKSEARVNTDSSFQSLKKADALLKELFDQRTETVPLQPEPFAKLQQRYRDEMSKIEALLETRNDNLYKVLNHEYDKKIIAVDEDAAMINGNSIKNISTNIYIHESFRILVDYIELLNKN